MRTLTPSIALVALALIACAPGAFAFTIVQNNATNSDGSPRFVDPDERFPGLVNPQSFGENRSTMQLGNTTLQFGVSPSYGGNYGANSRFLDSPASRTVPSQGFSPFQR